MKKYNEGGTTLREAYEVAKAEAVESGASIEFEFALVCVTVDQNSNYPDVEAAWSEGARKISYITRQL